MNYYDKGLLSHSKLKKIDKSYNEYIKPFDGNSRAMYLGTILDMALFEREKFELIPDAKCKFKAGTKGFKKEMENGIIFEQGLRPEVDKAVLTIKNHPIAMKYLQGNYQTEVYQNIFGRNCKGKLDVYNEKYITDFKATASFKGMDNTPRGIKKAMWWLYDWNYHTQLAFYNALICERDGLDKHYLDKYIVAYSWEDDDVLVIQLSEEVINEAEQKIQSWIDKLNAVEVFGEFKGISDKIIMVGYDSLN